MTADIQLADSLTRPIAPIGAATILVSASPRAMRADAAGSISAIGERSPMAIASP